MARFCTLFSGSNGNSTYISGSDTAVLVDAGRSCKQILEALSSRSIEPKSIDAILITHEHTDHISGLRVLLNRLKKPLYATAGVLEKLQWDGVISADQQVYTVESGKQMQIGSLLVDSFDTPHDSIHSVGYRFSIPDGRKLAIATDIGYISDEVRKAITGCDLVLLESNYEPGMLSACDYPYHLKQRIASNLGHLSNADCASELVHLVKNGTTRLILGHLSQNSNTPDIAYMSASCALQLGKLQEGRDFMLQVASRSGPSEMVIL